jgi:hypothetical protein
MVSSQVNLILAEFLVETSSRLDDVASGLGVDVGVVVVFAVLLHEGGDDEGGAAGHVGLAVEEDVVLRQHILDVALGGIEVREDVGGIEVFQVDPLAVLDLVLPQLLLDAEGVVGQLVDNAYHAVDPQIFDEIGVIERIHPAEVKIALLRVLLS